MLEESIASLDKSVATLIAQVQGLTNVLETVSKHQHTLLEHMEAAQSAVAKKPVKAAPKVEEPVTEAAPKAEEPVTEDAPKPAGRRSSKATTAAAVKATKVEEPVGEEVGSAKDVPLVKDTGEDFISEAALLAMAKQLVTSTPEADRGKVSDFIKRAAFSTGRYAPTDKPALAGPLCKLLPEDRNKCRFFIQRAAKLGIEGVDFDAPYDFNGDVEQKVASAEPVADEVDPYDF